jgi:hypothetical protein
MVLVASTFAQTMNVVVGSVTYQFPAAQAGEMTYDSGTTLSILGKTFTLTDIDEMYVDDTAVTDNLVTIGYDGTSATVTVAGNVAQYVEATVSGAHVSIVQSNTDAVDDDEITYQLSGTSTDGSLTLDGSYKCTISLAGVTLTNPNGAAISIENKKRIQLSAKSGTVNTLTDGANGSQKGCVYSKGQIQLQGKGTLNVAGNTGHAIKSGDYVSIKNLTLNITAAVKDGINCNKYFQMKSGTVTISGVGDDGIQADFESDDATTGETTGHEDENSANAYLEDGTLSVTVTGAATKGVKAGGDMKVSGGNITVKTTGNGTYDSSEKDAKGCAGLKSDGNMDISGGTLTLTSTGTGGKCIKCDGALTVSEGTISATSTGSKFSYGSYTASAKAIKSDGAMTITGGTINAASSSHEGIETKSTFTLSGGYVYSKSSDDAINSAGDMTISGGYIMAVSSGNDGLDANGNMTIKGGNIVAVSASGAEVAIDDAEGKTLSITGGNIVAIGGLERGANVTGTAYQASSYTKGAWYALYSGNDVAFAFKVPSNNNMGTPMVAYTSTGTTALKSGVTGSGTTFWSGNGYSSCSGGNSVTLSTYSGGNQGGPGGGGGGHGWH